MYAVQKGSSIYHLLDREDDQTVCGLRITGGQLKSKKLLGQIATKSSDTPVCKHCIRLAEVNSSIHRQKST